MRAAGTYFEQVPKAVIEKILAQQAAPAESKIRGDAVTEKPAAASAPNRTESRNSNP